MSNHLFVIAKITPKAEYFKVAKKAILEVVSPTLEEAGCRQFSVYESNMTLHLYEEWDNQAALDAHYSMPYIEAVFASYKEWLAEPVEINKLSKVG